ncbi:trichohyalin isoform X1 [Kryptolebias marmoratus]|uniref:Trichohyalin-like n=1 Tax=Kryptolebias marmoratus TaxID=37003 RepID=A0A3Q3F633_KRYMA|nr:trichohyalin isoform X1 [Kryptolebias marmoratus]
MGSKKAISTIFDTLSNLTIPDYKFHSSGRNSRDPSPASKTTASLEQERVNKQNRRGEVEQQQDIERDRGLDLQVREGEREQNERDRRHEYDRSRNGRLLSNVERVEPEQDMKKRGKKGDTYPRMKNVDRAPERKQMPPSVMEEDRRPTYPPKREEIDNWEKKRQGYRENRDGQNPRQRHPEDARTVKREQYKMSRAEFQDRTGERVDSRDMRDSEAGRKREKMRTDIDETKIYSLQRRPERERYTERNERPQRKEGMKDARNERDIDERELRRDQMKARVREQLIYQFSRNEGISRGKMQRERDQDGQRYRDRDRETKMDRSRRREEDNWQRDDEVSMRAVRQVDREERLRTERKFIDDRRVNTQYRNERRYMETNERQADVGPGKSSRSMSDSSQRPPPQVKSSGERTSAGDIEYYRQDRDIYRERERKTRNAVEERGKERHSESEGGADRSQKQQGRDREETTNSLPEKKRMWLEPQGGKNIKDKNRETYQRQKASRREEEMNVESRSEKGRPGWREKAKPDERNLEQSCYKERHRGRDDYSGDSEGVNEDGDDEVGEIWTEREGKEHLSDSGGGTEERRQGDVQREIMIDTTEESGTEEDGGGEYWACTGNEGGSDPSWKQDIMLSGENTCVTLSSGGNSEDEREDCKLFCEPDVSDEDSTPVSSKSSEGDEREDLTTRNEEVVKNDAQGRKKKPKYVFYETGKSHFWSETTELSPSENDAVGGAETDESNLEKHNQSSDEATHDPRDDQELKSSRNDEQSFLRNQDKESDDSSPRENGLPSGDATEVAQLSEEMRSKSEPQPKGLGEVKRDSKTERLLQHWRENNKGAQGNSVADPHSQDSSERIPLFLDDINIDSMSQEQMDEVRIQMSKVWESKRHSQAPHLKWAKTVVQSILGHSDEQAVDEPNTEPQQDQGVQQFEHYHQQDMIPQRSFDLPIFTVTRDDQQSDPELEEEDLEVELRDDDHSKSWGEVNLRNAFDRLAGQQGNSILFNAAQLYQQYNEAAQNFEILRQTRSDVLSLCEDPNLSPMPSPPPARRPLPPLPVNSAPLSHACSVSSAKTLPLPEVPRPGRRASSPRLSVALTNHSSLWRDLPDVKNNPELGMLTEDQRRLQEVRFEVVTSEASYCRSLDIVVDHFVKSKQLELLLTAQDKNWLFSRLADVRVISRRFLSKLEERVESDIMHFTVCDIIVKQCQRFRIVYVPYLTNQSYQDTTYQKLMNGNPSFKRIVDTLERSPICQRLPLRSFLVLPFQRITRLKLLVQNIVKRTTPGTVEATSAIKALKHLEKMIQESNDSISQMKNIESLLTLNSRVDFECRTLPLISQSRRLVREGLVTQLMDLSLKERNIYMHLFNDYLLISVQKEGGRFTVIDHCPVQELRVENFRVKLLSLQKNVFRLHGTNEPMLLRTESQSDKLRWISAISRSHCELDFSAAEDLAQMQCIRSYVAQQPDELSLEKADVILVHQDTSDNWVEGTKLSDLQRGWVPKSHLEVITNLKAKKHNLSDAYKLTKATAAV